MKVVVRRKVWVCGLLLAVLMSCIFPVKNCAASGNTIYVDDSNTSGPWNGTLDYPYQRIQEGVNAANPGDTVYVFSGTYDENVEISINLTLTGENKDTTIIDGGKNGHVVYVYGTASSKIVCYVSGFTIRNAGGTGNDCVAFSHVDNGGINSNKILNSKDSDGIQLDHCSYIEISNNEITNNKAAGISLSLSKNCVIHDNTIQNNQKGVYIYSNISSDSNEIYNNVISSNSQFGVYIVGSSDNRIYHNRFENNDQNARDMGSNVWDNGYPSGGNYWDDYTGVDNDGDDIGDTPYDIPGKDPPNQDRYPLVGSQNQQPTAYINSISPNPAVQGETVYFDGHGTDDGRIIGWEWQSDLDGVLSYSEDFSTSTLSVGTHTIRFKVKDKDEQWSSYAVDTLVINSQSTANQKPTAEIVSVKPSNVIAGEYVYFHGFGKDPDGMVVEYSWRSSVDGVLSDSSTFNTSNLTVGTHTIYFKVKDDSGEWSDEVSTEVVVNPNASTPVNKYPVANAGGLYSCYVDEKISLIGSGSYDEDGTIIEYFWDFGDGTIGRGVSPTHIYSRPGNYTVVLTVKDDSGSIASDVTYVNVVQKTSQGSSGSSSGGSLGFEIQIPFIVIFEIIFITFAILMFLLWIKRK